MRVIDGAELARLTPYPLLAAALRQRISGVVSPPRAHLDPTGRGDSLLLMPAWREGGLLGVKLVTVYPGNADRGQPAVAACYAAFDQRDGRPVGLLDGTVLTLRRTAAATALAASMLAKPDARCVLICGTGALAPELARAHAALLPGLVRVLVWGRNAAKARAVVQALAADGLAVHEVADLEAGLREADIVAAATTATRPFLRADAIRPGMHLGLVGAFTPAMAEAEPALLAGTRLFADDREAVLAKGGEVVQAIAAGLLAPTAIEADLCALFAAPPKREADDITVFKSVGFAALDLVAAELALGRLLGGSNAA